MNVEKLQREGDVGVPTAWVVIERKGFFRATQ